MRRNVVTLLLGLIVGALVGIGVGWLVPITDVGVSFDKLSPDYEAEYTVMVGAAYGVDGDWDAVQGRLSLLGEPDPAGYVVRLAERYIAEGRNPDDIRNLVRLSARYGYLTAPMQPYAPTSPAPPAPPTAAPSPTAATSPTPAPSSTPSASPTPQPSVTGGTP